MKTWGICLSLLGFGMVLLGVAAMLFIWSLNDHLTSMQLVKTGWFWYSVLVAVTGMAVFVYGDNLKRRSAYAAPKSRPVDEPAYTGYARTRPTRSQRALLGCPSCKRDVSLGDNYCPQCGAFLNGPE